MTAAFELECQQFTALNGGPHVVPMALPEMLQDKDAKLDGPAVS
jgi:hypothetical protein